jgi:hypothetical protein
MNLALWKTQHLVSSYSARDYILLNTPLMKPYFVLIRDSMLKICFKEFFVVYLPVL